MPTLDQSIKQDKRPRGPFSRLLFSLVHGLAKQASNPNGLFGKLFGSAMKKMNFEANKWIISLLQIEPDDYVLEVGFGPGDGIKQLTDIITRGRIIGIDCSGTMYKTAGHRNRQAIDKGLVKLHIGNADSIGYPDNYFHKLYLVHVIYFWDKPLTELKELHRVMKEGGKIAIFVGKKSEMSEIKLTQTGVYQLYDEQEMESLLSKAGFTDIQSQQKSFTQGPISTGVCVIAKKPANNQNNA